MLEPNHCRTSFCACYGALRQVRLSNLFHRNRSKAQLDAIVRDLKDTGIVSIRSEGEGTAKTIIYARTDIGKDRRKES